MPRPQSKRELLIACDDGYAKLISAIDALTVSQQKMSFPFDHRDKNIRDVLAHLHEWHLMMLAWYETGMSGAKPEMPAAGYTWRTTPDLNAQIWAKYQSMSLSRIRKSLDDSHQNIRATIDQHTNDELFEKRRYAWTGTTSLGSYLISATSSHYAWATKLIRRSIRDRR